jgi:beta-galactosidase
MAWVDIPFTRSPFFSDIALYDTPRFRANGEQQLREIILQNINHPSVIMWGIFSLLRGNDSAQMEYVRQLNSLSKRLDSSRPTVACSNQDGDINFITDLIVWQQSIGWERGEIADLEIWQEALKSGWSNLKQAICYGESLSTGKFGGQIPYNSNTKRPSPRWLIQFHEGYTQHIDEELFWGVWVNSMFDYGSARYAQGVFRSGLVDIDHKHRKDLFYLYKSLWNKRKPTLHIVGKGVDIRSSERQVLSIYSSAGRPTLTINGDTVATKNVGRAIYRTDTLMLKGENRLKVGVGEIADSMTLTIGNYLRRQ